MSNLPVYSTPDAHGRVAFRSGAKSAGVPRRGRSRPDGWVKVVLPIRPAGRTGWVRAADVTMSAGRRTASRSRSAPSASRCSGGAGEIYRGPIVVGASAPLTPPPTPPGHYYLRAIAHGAEVAHHELSRTSTTLINKLVGAAAARHAGRRRPLSGQSANAASGSAYVLSSITLPLGSAIIALVCARDGAGVVGGRPLQPLRPIRASRRARSWASSSAAA